MIVRLLCCFLTSFFLVLLLMPHFIDHMKRIGFNQNVSEYSLEEYKNKAKTPVMGGVLFVTVPTICSLVFFPDIFMDLDTAIVLLVFVGYGLIGFLDDYLIVVKHNNDGLKPWQKFSLQLLLAILFYLVFRRHAVLDIVIPFTGFSWNLGRYYVLLILFMFTGSSNAVNLTDGMDGLAAGCTEIALIPFLIFAWLDHRFALCGFILALLGALLGYLRYNVHPAKVFMGDTGSLALGAALAAIAMVLKKELALAVIGGVFVIETLCVIIQISSVKLTGHRVFPYTPIHYAFVLKGMNEQKVVRMFWIAGCIFALLGLFIGLH